MILSSADILRVLGADAIVRQEARLSVVDGNPGYGVEEYVYIYIDKYPTVSEFEATWKIWVQDSSGMGKYVLDVMTIALPNFDFKGTHYTTTDFASDRTVVKTEVEKQVEQLASERIEYRKDFEGLSEHVEGVLKGVRNGRDGKDGVDGLEGRPGRDGKDGRDGRDIDATQTELFDLKDVDESGIPLEMGQVLTWDGAKWTNLYVRTSSTISGGGGGGGGEGGGIPEAPVDGQQYARQDATWTVVQAGGGGGGIPEAPMDGNFYVRQNATWVNLKDALSQLGVPVDEPIDGGNFTTGFSAATSNTPADGGNFTTGAGSAEHNVTLDGGNYTTGQTAADEFSAFGL